MINVTFVELVFGFVIALVLMATEYLLCTKLKSPLWGGIIPCLILAGTIWYLPAGRFRWNCGMFFRL